MDRCIFHEIGSRLKLLFLVGLSASATWPFIPIVLFYRILVWATVKFTRPDLDSFVAGDSAGYTSHDPTKAVCNLLLCFDIEGEISAGRIRQMFQERVLNLKNVKGKLVYQRLQQDWINLWGYSFWRDDKNFRIDNHVRNYDYKGELALPSPCCVDDLCNVWPKLAEAPWKRHQSPWEFLVVPRYTSSETAKHNTLLIFRINHIHCDLYSLIGLFRVLFNSPFTTPEASLNVMNLTWMQRLRAVLLLPFEMTKYFQLVLKGRHIGGRRKTSYCRTIFSDKVSIQKIKEIKLKYGVEFSSVVHCAVQGALARAFQNAGQEAPKSNNLIYVVPLPNHRGGWCMHATSVCAEMPCASLSSMDRLAQCDEILRKSTNALPYSVALASKLLALAPTSFIRQFLQIFFKHGPCFGMSNFPTTLSRDFVDGLEIVDVFATVSSSEHFGLMITSWGVNSQQRFSFFFVETIFGDEVSAGKLAEYFEQELKVLQTGN